jgi:hypothetical protein
VTEQWEGRRRRGWHQTPEGRLADAGAGADFVRRAGVVTLFPVSPEVPDLFHAHTGDPEARPETKWDSPAGEVFGWRWGIGRPGAACYTTFVLRRPTWVSWDLLPAALRLRDALRTPEELHAAGALSAGAHRVARVLADCDGVLSTGVLRVLAGYPTGRAERAAFLRAVAELDDRLLLAKVFADEDEDMRHALVHVRYPQHVAAARDLSFEAALDELLMTYLPLAAYARPAALARAFGVAPAAVLAGLQRLAEAGRAAPEPGPGESIYLSTEGEGAPPLLRRRSRPARIEDETRTTTG